MVIKKNNKNKINIKKSNKIIIQIVCGRVNYKYYIKQKWIKGYDNRMIKVNNKQ